MPPRRASYTTLQIGLHWLTALLVIAAWVTSDEIHDLLDEKLAEGYAGTPLHVGIGLTILTVVGARLVLRLRDGAPGALEGTPDAMARARRWGHIALYALLVGVPLGGFSVWFAEIEAMGSVHGAGANALLALAGGHAGLALYHHYARRDGTLLRMIRPGD